MRKISIYIFIILLLCVIGLFIRIYGNDFGLPALYHQDEKATLKVALRFGSGDLNPHYFWHPNLLHYFLFVVFGFYFVFGYIFGQFSSLLDFQNLFFINPSSFYLIARTIGALFGAATIPLTYILAKKVFDRRVGLLSALFITFNFLHVHESHYMRHDVPVTFFIVLAYIFFYSLLSSGGRRNYCLSGLATGLAISTNWNAGLLLLSLFAAHILHLKEIKKYRDFLGGNFRFCFYMIFWGIFIGTPYMIFDSGTFLQHFFEQGAKSVTLFPFLVDSAWKYYLTVSLKTAFGMPLAIFSIAAALFIFLFRRKTKYFLIILWPFLYFAVFCGFKNMSSAYMTPLLPFLSITAASFLFIIYDWLKSKIRYVNIALVLIVGLLIFLPIRDILYYDYLLTRKDTRTQAKEWIEKHVPRDEKIAVEAYIAFSAWVPQLNETREEAEYILKQMRIKDKTSGRYRESLLNLTYPKNTYNLIEIVSFRHIDEKYENYYDFDDLLRKGVKYVVVSEAYQTIYSDEEFYPKPVAFYRDLNSRARLIKKFSPYIANDTSSRIREIESWYTPFSDVTKLRYPGPVISIYEIAEKSSNL